MKNFSIILFVAIVMTVASQTVWGASVYKVPALTTLIEKATPHIVASNGTVVQHPIILGHYDALDMQPIIIYPVYWVDETFFNFGYKAKLSTFIHEIAVPPDRRNNEEKAHPLLE